MKQLLLPLFFTPEAQYFFSASFSVSVLFCLFFIKNCRKIREFISILHWYNCCMALCSALPAYGIYAISNYFSTVGYNSCEPIPVKIMNHFIFIHITAAAIVLLLLQIFKTKRNYLAYGTLTFLSGIYCSLLFWTLTRVN